MKIQKKCTLYWDNKTGEIRIRFHDTMPTLEVIYFFHKAAFVMAQKINKDFKDERNKIRRRRFSKAKRSL